MKMDWNRVSFLVAFITCAVLVGLGKIPAQYLTAFVGWLAPSPMKPVDDGHNDSVDHSPEEEK